MQMSVLLHKSIENLLYTLIPSVCFACHCYIEDQYKCLCPNCLAKVKRNMETKQFPKELGYIYIESVVSLYYYELVVRDLIHNYKFREAWIIGRYFADIANKIIREEFPYLMKVDAIIAVSMHRIREKERLFNQTTFLAGKLSKLLEIPNYSRFVKKIKNPSPQSLSLFKERLVKPANSFKVSRKADLKGKSLMILDDVLTTGATANELAKTLKASGAKEVHVFTIASGYSAMKRLPRPNYKVKIPGEIAT